MLSTRVSGGGNSVSTSFLNIAKFPVAAFQSTGANSTSPSSQNLPPFGSPLHQQQQNPRRCRRSSGLDNFSDLRIAISLVASCHMTAEEASKAATATKDNSPLGSPPIGFFFSTRISSERGRKVTAAAKVTRTVQQTTARLLKTPSRRAHQPSATLLRHFSSFTPVTGPDLMALVAVNVAQRRNKLFPIRRSISLYDIPLPRSRHPSCHGSRTESGCPQDYEYLSRAAGSRIQGHKTYLPVASTTADVGISFVASEV